MQWVQNQSHSPSERHFSFPCCTSSSGWRLSINYNCSVETVWSGGGTKRCVSCILFPISWLNRKMHPVKFGNNKIKHFLWTQISAASADFQEYLDAEKSNLTSLARNWIAYSLYFTLKENLCGLKSIKWITQLMPYFELPTQDPDPPTPQNIIPGFYYYINQDCNTSAWHLASNRFFCRTNNKSGSINSNKALYLVFSLLFNQLCSQMKLSPWIGNSLTLLGSYIELQSLLEVFLNHGVNTLNIQPIKTPNWVKLL